MNVGIDISPIIYGTGVSDYTSSLVEALLGVDKKDLFVLFGTSLRQRGELKRLSKSFERGNAYAKVFPFPPTLLPEYWHRIRFPKIERLIGKVDVYHSSDWVQPPTAAAKVTTVHDLFFLKHPETTHPKILATQKMRLKWVKKEVDRIIAVSQATKEDIIDLLKIPEEKIRVIYEAMPTKIKKVSDKRIISKTLEKFGIKGNYVLAVGTREPRKNLKRIIEGFSKLRSVAKAMARPSQPLRSPTLQSFGDGARRRQRRRQTLNHELQLVIVGRFGWGKDISPQRNVILTGYVSDLELSILYQKAQCFVYTSLYEGFGQPILEAMYLGCPVVTSNVSSMPEVAGDAAVLVNPESSEEIAYGIKQAIKVRNDLVKEGFKQVKKFSWEKCARETLEVYREAIKC